MTADVEYSGRESFWPFARLVKTFCRHPMASELPIKRKDYVDETLKLQTWSSFHSPFRHVKKKRYSLVNQSKVLSRFDGSKEQARGGTAVSRFVEPTLLSHGRHWRMMTQSRDSSDWRFVGGCDDGITSPPGGTRGDQSKRTRVRHQVPPGGLLNKNWNVSK